MEIILTDPPQAGPRGFAPDPFWTGIAYGNWE
jgi:hypothetical protein